MRTENMLSDKFTEITKQNGLYNIQAISNISSIMEKGIVSYEKNYSQMVFDFGNG